jgi:hypothetical protein
MVNQQQLEAAIAAAVGPLQAALDIKEAQINDLQTQVQALQVSANTTRAPAGGNSSDLILSMRVHAPKAPPFTGNPDLDRAHYPDGAHDAINNIEPQLEPFNNLDKVPVFQRFLSGRALQWHNHFVEEYARKNPSGTVRAAPIPWDVYVQAFLAHFHSARWPKDTYDALTAAKMGSGSVRDFATTLGMLNNRLHRSTDPNYEPLDDGALGKLFRRNIPQALQNQLMAHSTDACPLTSIAEIVTYTEIAGLPGATPRAAPDHRADGTTPYQPRITPKPVPAMAATTGDYLEQRAHEALDRGETSFVYGNAVHLITRVEDDDY